MRSLLLASLLIFAANAHAFEVAKAVQPPVVDGVPDDLAWASSNWRELDQVILGSTPTPGDFSGRYKLLWSQHSLHLLVEITDDVLIDTHADPLQEYWNDDMLEIFVDEDASGGIHTDDYNAFAYHLSLDNQVVDIGPANGVAQPRLFNDHVLSRWRRDAADTHRVYWEAQIALHNSDHVYGDDATSRIELRAGKELGFMVAYGDADDTESGRELFIGDVAIEPVDGDRNRGYIDADVFGRIVLVERNNN